VESVSAAAPTGGGGGGFLRVQVSDRSTHVTEPSDIMTGKSSFLVAEAAQPISATSRTNAADQRSSVTGGASCFTNCPELIYFL